MTRTGRGRPALTCLVALPALAAPVEFYQTVNRKEVGSEDTFQLTIVSANAPDSAMVQFPAYKDFEVLSKSQSTQMSYQFGGVGPGSINRVQKYVLILRANRTGRLTIPAATLTTAAQNYRTEPVEITVKKGHSEGANQPPRGQRNPFGQLPDPFQGFPFPRFPGEEDDEPGGAGGSPEVDIPRSDSDLFLKATVDRTAVYVGEQITLSLYIFSRVELSSVDAVTMPKLDGFWSEDIESPTQLAPEERIINGIRYRAYLLKRRALFPVKAGTIAIGPTEADITTGFIFSAHRVHRVSNELSIKVKPLPPGAPPGFSSSSVGNWRLSVQASQTQVELGQPVTIKVMLDGQGNLKNVVAPPLTGPSGLKIYDPTTSDKVNATNRRYGGRRVQEYLVMPQQTGSFTLPGLSFPYFNPQTGTYEVSRTDPIALTVVQGTGGAQATGANPGASVPSAKNVLASGGLKPLRLAAHFAAVSAPVWRKGFFFPAVLFPGLLWLAVVLGSLVRAAATREDEGSRKRKKAKEASRRLAEARKLQASGKASEFYAEVEKALMHFLEAKLGVPVGGLTRDGLMDRMIAAGVPEPRRAVVVKALERCDAGRFAPGAGDVERKQALEDAEDAMEGWGSK